LLRGESGVIPAGARGAAGRPASSPSGADIVRPRPCDEAAGVRRERARRDLCRHGRLELCAVCLGDGRHRLVIGTLDVDAVEFGACLAIGAVHRLGLTFASTRRVLLPSEDVFLATLGLGD